jgi:hypothetical protein
VTLVRRALNKRRSGVVFGGFSLRATSGQFDGKFERGFTKKLVLSAGDFLEEGPVIKECGLAPG